MSLRLHIRAYTADVAHFVKDGTELRCEEQQCETKRNVKLAHGDGQHGNRRTVAGFGAQSSTRATGGAGAATRGACRPANGLEASALAP
jgi:hypothetical protein